MSIFNPFRSSTKPTESEEADMNRAISSYRDQVIEERAEWAKPLEKQNHADLKRIMRLLEARRVADTLLQELQEKGRDVVGFRCFFHTAAVGEMHWIGEDTNRRRVAADFAMLKKSDIRRYEMLRGLYWASYAEFWGSFDAEGRRTIPIQFYAYPGEIFPSGERQGF